MRRLIIVYNPRSSRHAEVRSEVLDKTTGLRGYMVGRYEVRPTDVDDNATKLAQVIQDGDLVIAAGGDGTATIGLNGCMLSGKDVTYGVLGFGNFNDFARMLGAETIGQIASRFEQKNSAKEIYPLEAIINNRHWRYAACYFTIGLFAESTQVFDQPEIREELKKGNKTFAFSAKFLAKWYFQNKKRQFLPSFSINHQTVKPKTTDYVAINGKTVAKMIPGGNWYQSPEKFWSGTARLGSFFRLVWLGIRAITKHLPGHETMHDTLNFIEPSNIMIQAEGEYQKFSDVTTVEIRKAPKPLKVISFDS